MSPSVTGSLWSRSERASREAITAAPTTLTRLFGRLYLRRSADGLSTLFPRLVTEVFVLNFLSDYPCMSRAWRQRTIFYGLECMPTAHFLAQIFEGERSSKATWCGILFGL